MALVNGPLFSLDASGQLGKAIVYTKWKGRNVVREFVIPANPRTLGQHWQRGQLGIMSRWWATMSGANKTTWDDLASASNISPFNAFVGYGLSKMVDGVRPQVAFPYVTEVAPTGALNVLTAAGDVGKITGLVTITTTLAATDQIVLGLSTTSNVDGELIHHSVASRVGGGTTSWAYELPGIPPGTYYVVATLISATGGADTPIVYASNPVTVT